MENLAREGRIDLGAVFDRLPTPFMVLDRDFHYVGMNQAYLDVTARTRESVLGRHILEAFPSEGDSRRLLIESLERARATGRPDELAFLEYAIPRPDQNGGGFETRYWSCTHTPVPGPDGETQFIVQHTQDVTELYALRQGAGSAAKGDVALLGQQVLRRAEAVQAEGAELRRLFNAAPGFMAIMKGPDHVIEWCNAAYSRLVGRGDLVGRRVWDIMPDIAAQGYSQLLDSVYRTREPFVGRGMRILFERTAGGPAEEHFLDFIYQPVLGDEGECTGIFIQGADVTDAVRAQHRQRLLLNELNHRVKNTLATVQAILGQTLKSSSAADFAVDLQSRIQGLARTHEVLTQAEWLGAALLDLLEAELAPFGRDRFRLAGPALTLAPKTALALGMVFHELTVNAAKYGALSPRGGEVTVTWAVESGEPRPCLALSWTEAGGPRVKPPTRQGFGARLIDRTLSGELSGRAQLSYEEEGFQCYLRVPLEPLNA